MEPGTPDEHIRAQICPITWTFSADGGRVLHRSLTKLNDLDLLLLLDNYATHDTKVEEWLIRHPASTCTSPRPAVFLMCGAGTLHRSRDTALSRGPGLGLSRQLSPRHGPALTESAPSPQGLGKVVT